jgi:hypothetical protein
MERILSAPQRLCGETAVSPRLRASAVNSFRI